MNRRQFCRRAALLGGAVMLSPLMGACARATPMLPTAFPIPTDTPSPSPPTKTATTSPSVTPSPTEETAMPTTSIALVKTNDRAEGVRRALALLGTNPASGKRVLLKPNFNSADPTPGSTHPDVLRTLVTALYDMGAQTITVGDRSGMGDTKAVMRRLGVYDMAAELGFGVVQFDALEESAYAFIQSGDLHWSRGFAVPKMLLEAECVVQTCCLKTHRYGGHFTLSLKNSVGLVAKTVPGSGYNYMTELHNSPYQRLMIAEINIAYSPALIVLDGVEAFVDGGPDRGTKVQSQVVLAGTDRVAIDAVGVAILRLLGTTPEVSRGRIFEQEQIARAVELGLGVSDPMQITFLTDDAESAAYADRIKAVLVA